jgi:hypothetical protein
MYRCFRAFFSIVGRQCQQRERAEGGENLNADDEERESAETIRSGQCDERSR